MRHLSTMRFWLTAIMVSVVSSPVWAGTGGGAPGGGDDGPGGGGGPEPEVIALMLFSLVPGFFFARKAMISQRESIDIT